MSSLPRTHPFSHIHTQVRTHSCTRTSTHKHARVTLGVRYRRSLDDVDDVDSEEFLWLRIIMAFSTKTLFSDWFMSRIPANDSERQKVGFNSAEDDSKLKTRNRSFFETKCWSSLNNKKKIIFEDRSADMAEIKLTLWWYDKKTAPSREANIIICWSQLWVSWLYIRKVNRWGVKINQQETEL